MGHSKMEVILPGGQIHELRDWMSKPDASLAQVLEENGIPLNMRCGGRGLCRGCQVRLQDGNGETEIRSCQHKVEAVLTSIQKIVLPENSWRDHSLHGVSAFEIHTLKKPASSRKTGYGVALDIGTTTLAAALWDFSEDRCLSHGSYPNPQMPYGDNLISRIHFETENNEGSSILQRSLVEDGLNPMLKDLCLRAGIEMKAISCATVAGNPTMLHTLAGEPLSGFGSYPFNPVFLDERKLDSRALGFPHLFELNLLPSLGPFVGADIAVGALASGMLEKEGPILLIDFGTNGEMLLSHAGKFLATATAAGPAFEGGRLSCGATARDGVISSILRETEAWSWILSEGGDREPNGISGAAYVDFLAQGRACGLVDRYGRFDRQSSEVYDRISGNDSDWAINISRATYVTEADVAELLQAKAAIGGGIMTLLGEAGLAPSDLKRVWIAGGFGYHLNPEHAMAIGLLPAIPFEKIRMIGNASLGGACLLLNRQVGEDMKPLMQNSTVLELNQIDSFEDHYTDALALEPMATESF